MKNSEKFIKDLKNGKYRRHTFSIRERFGWIEDYSIIKEQTELNNYIHFINSRRGEELQNVKVKVYKGDN